MKDVQRVLQVVKTQLVERLEQVLLVGKYPKKAVAAINHNTYSFLTRLSNSNVCKMTDIRMKNSMLASN